MRAFHFVDPARVSLVGMSMGGVVAGIVAAEEPGIRAACLWSPAAVAPFAQIGSGYLKGRDIAAQIRDKGYFDADGHRMSPALIEDISNLDLYGRSSPYTGPVRITTVPLRRRPTQVRAPLPRPLLRQCRTRGRRRRRPRRA